MPRRKKAEKLAPVPLHLIDTNVILRYLMGDDPEKSARTVSLMERVEQGQEIVEIPEAVVTEAVWTLESFYQVPRIEIAQNLTGLLSLVGVRTQWRETLLMALQYYASSKADFVDCLLAAFSKHKDLSVYTFDETDFRKLDIHWEKP